MPRVTKIKRTRERHFIKEWRIFRGLTQEQMASRVQLSRENYGRIEGGKVPYNQDFLELAAYALRCDPADPSSSWSIMDSLKKADASTRERIAAVVEALLKTGS